MKIYRIVINLFIRENPLINIFYKYIIYFIFTLYSIGSNDCKSNKSNLFLDVGANNGISSLDLEGWVMKTYMCLS